MTLTTPVQERYTRFSCPNPPCAPCNRPGDGNIAPRSWTGTRTHIARLRCMACDREFSEREGTRMARSKLPEDTVIQRVQCQRWGVCDEGTAEMCAVDRTTVPRLQQGAAQRAETPHRQVVRGVDEQHLANLRRKDLLPQLSNDRATCLLCQLFRLGLRRFCLLPVSFI